MFFTAVRQALYKTRLSKYPTVLSIDQDVKMTWSNNILWFSKEGKKDIPIYFDNKSDLEKEVDNIIHTFNEIDQKNTADRMIYYLQMREEERKKKLNSIE